MAKDNPEFEADTHECGGAGGDSLAGYEYQADVSVWLALDLVLATKLAHELVLEPASQEDVEADLGEFEPGRITSEASIPQCKLVVQAKLRTGDAWTVAGIKSLLKYGSDFRKSAAERLSAPDIRYLLVTSASLNGGARELSVRRAGVWPKPEAMPRTIAEALPAGAAGRVGIVGNLDEERLASEIKRLLTESFRVPNARWAECRRALKEEARIRIGGAGFGRWRRDDLEGLIRRHEGYIASSPELDQYVYPLNWRSLREKMNSHYAALIIGQSGTGKTMATKKLYEELRESIPGLSRVSIAHGPEQLRDDQTEPPVLYDVEDPWGRFDFNPNSRPWNDQLANCLAHATHDRMIVATSRRDVAESAGALDSVQPWVVALEAEQYGDRERRQLFRTRIDALPRTLQSLATQAEKTVLAKLSTPLEIQKFFDALLTTDRAAISRPSNFIAEAIHRAHQDSIERTVIEQVEQRKDVPAAAIIWGLLKASDSLSLSLLRVIEEEMADRDRALTEGVTPLVQFFVAARNLRQAESTVSYYHPRVESGIERTLGCHSLVVRRTLRQLVDVLTSMDFQGEKWGIGASARLIAAASTLPDLRLIASDGAQKKIDTWLAAEIAKADKDFRSSLQLAALAGSSGSVPSEVARFLLHTQNPNQGQFGFGYVTWKLQPHDAAWYLRILADPATKSIVETFIREILPTEHYDFPDDFATEVERIAPGLTGAFLMAAERIVKFGFTHTADAIIAGALNDLDGFERIVSASVSVLTPTEAQLREQQETHLAIINVEYSEEYADHFADNDDGYMAGEFLQAYVDRVRRVPDWPRITRHPHRERLLPYWLRSLANDPARCAEEVADAFAASYGNKDEDEFWIILLKSWDPIYMDALVNRVIEGHDERSVRVSALTCLLERAPRQVATISDALITAGNHRRLINIAIEIGQLRHGRSMFDGERHTDAGDAGRSALPPVYSEIADAALAIRAGSQPPFSTASRDVIIGIRDANEELRAFRVALDRSVNLPVSEDVRWLLAETTDSNVAVEAIDAAIRHGMTAEIEAAVNHRFAKVVARALTAVAEPLAAPLPSSILNLANARGSPVRRAIVDVLDAKPHQAHLPTLLHLLKDQWSTGLNYYGAESEHPIAQAAVRAIAKLGALTTETADQLYHVAIDTADPAVRSKLLEFLAKAGGLSERERLLELASAPGRVAVRRAAAIALVVSSDSVESELVLRITPELLASRVQSVATLLALLLSMRGDPLMVTKAAAVLATNSKRRVLLILFSRVLAERDRDAAKKIADMLPAKHAAVALDVSEEIEISDELLADLGDPASVAEVLHYIKPKKT
jgi:hypothetical protein